MSRSLAKSVRRTRGVPRLLPATAILAVGSVLCGAPASAADDIAGDPESVRQAPHASAPKIRWWWPQADLSQQELDRELAAVKAAGFRGVEQVLYNGKVDTKTQWGSPAWTDHTVDTIVTATELGLSFDTTLGPTWPMASPAVDDPADRLSMQDLHYGVADVAGGTRFDGPVPDSAPNRPAEQQQRDLVAVTAVRVPDPSAPTVLDPSSARDLTNSVDDEGNLTWHPPGGVWKVFGFWMRPSYQDNGWLVADHLSKEATMTVLEDYDRRVFGGANAETFRMTDGDVFEDSFEIHHGTTAAGQSALFWTPSFLDEFRERRGYDVTRLLPGLFAEFTFADKGDARVQRDYELTFDDLAIDNHMKIIEDWAQAHGLRYRAQAYEAGVGDFGVHSNMRLATAASAPDVETLGFGDPGADFATSTAKWLVPGSAESRTIIDKYRQVVSGAHVSGADEVSNEFGATLFEAFREDADHYKALADRSFAAGVTTQILHGLPYQRYDDGVSPSWPGWCTWCNIFYGPLALQISEAWSPKAPQWKHWPGLNGYMARIGAVLRNGKPQVDLVMVDDQSAVGSRGPVSSATDAQQRALLGSGFTWDTMDPTVLQEEHDVAGGRLLPDGPAYKALVVNHQQALAVDTARAMLRTARRGVPVIIYGELPRSGVSYRNPQREDQDVRDTIQALLALPNTAHVTAPDQLTKALTDRSVFPDFGEPAEQEVVPVHRRTASGDQWVLYNNSTKPVTTTFRFAAKGIPTLIDPWTGKATRLANYRTIGGVTRVPMTIEAADTAIIAFNRSTRNRHVVQSSADQTVLVGKNIWVRDTKGGTVTYRLDNGRSGKVRLPRTPSPRTLQGGWQLTATTVAPNGNSVVNLDLRRLTDWRYIPELAGKSGTGNYTRTFRVSKSWLTKGRGVTLAPGEIHGTLFAWINGRRVEMPTVGDIEVDITKFLRAGKNRIRMQLATTLNNTVVSSGKAGVDRFAPFADRTFTAAGLTGEVVLKPYVKTKIFTE